MRVLYGLICRNRVLLGHSLCDAVPVIDGSVVPYAVQSGGVTGLDLNKSAQQLVGTNILEVVVVA